MIRTRHLLTLLPIAGLLGACVAGGVNEPSGSDDDDHQGSGGTGSQGGDPTAVCGVSKAGPPALRRLSKRELTRTLEDIFPQVKGQWSVSMSADPLSRQGFDNNSAALIVSKQTAREIADTASSLAAAVTGSALTQILPCASAGDRNCASQFLDTYGKRLFRRPLTEEDKTRYLGLYDQAAAQGDFKKSLGLVLRAMVQSPHSLYRREIGAIGGDGKLNQYEIATALAYTYGGSTPSDALLAQADRGELKSPEQLVAAAKAMLESESGEGVVHHFFESWIGYGRVRSITKDGVENFTALRDQMYQETQNFVQEVVFTRKGGTRELLTANYTTPSKSLATFYGLTAPGTDYGVVNRPAGRGVGLLSQGAVLSTFALPDGSSPTKRGLLVLDKVLCRERPEVPDNVPPPPAQQPGVTTTRQRYEQAHAGVEPCKGCHSQFDPIGFGFEHFDQAGRYRDSEGGLAINSASHVPAEDGTLFEFTGLDDLAQKLADDESVGQCVSGHVATFAFGGPQTCVGETRRADFMSGKIGFIEYLASLAGEPHFTERRLK